MSSTKTFVQPGSDYTDSTILYAADLRPKSNGFVRFQALQAIVSTAVPLDFKTFGMDIDFARTWRHYTQLSPGVGRLNKTLVNQARLVQPDILWVDKGLKVSSDSLQAIEREAPDALKVHYNPDDPFGTFARGLRRLPWRTFLSAIPAYDVHLVAREQNKPEFLNRGADRVEAFDRSYAPEIHRPMKLSYAEQKTYGASVGFIGSYARARSQSVASLIRAGIDVAIWGDGWSQASQWDILEPHWRGPSIYGDDYARAISGMDIALHFLRRENRDEQDSRTFEIPACGSFMLAERSDAHERLFDDADEAVFFDDDADLLEKVRYYSAHSKERERIARAGRQRGLTDGYDHYSRLEQLLDVVVRDDRAS